MTEHESVRAGLREQAIELPSWAFGNSGTRFKVFAQEGVPRDPFEKIADAAQVHTFTGVAPTVSLHIPWDLVDDFAIHTVGRAVHVLNAPSPAATASLEIGREIATRLELDPG